MCLWHRASARRRHCVGTGLSTLRQMISEFNQTIEQLAGRICRCLMICGRGVDDTALVGDLADEMLRLLRLQ